MRNRRHQPPDQPPSRPPVEPAPAAGYDWQQFGRHRLRAPGSVVVDFPVITTGAAQVWVATLWPDPRTPGRVGPDALARRPQHAEGLVAPRAARRRRRPRVRRRQRRGPGPLVRDHGLLRIRPLDDHPRPLPKPDDCSRRGARAPRPRTIPPRARTRTTRPRHRTRRATRTGPSTTSSSTPVAVEHDAPQIGPERLVHRTEVGSYTMSSPG